MPQLLHVALVAASCLCNVAFTSDTKPIEKVTGMLTKLRDQVTEEGIAEATTYNKFACFCKTTVEEKTKAIADGKTERDSLRSKIEADSATRDEEDLNIADGLKTVKETEAELAQEKAERKTERMTYDKNEMELEEGIQALDAAILRLKATKKAVGFAQLPAETRHALVMAQALLSGKVEKNKKLMSYIANADPNDAYAFHSDDLIQTLEDLKVSFKSKKDEIDQTELDAKTAFEELEKNKLKTIADAEEAIETAKKDKAAASGRIASASRDLTSTSATLLDDQAFLQKLSDECGEKASLWDKRTRMRAAELQALTQALVLIQSLPPPDGAPAPAAPGLLQHASAAAAPAPAFVQLTSQAHRARLMHQEALHAARVDAHKQEDSIAQAATPVATQLGGRRARVLAMLRQQAQLLKSSALSNLVESAAKDPFAKVKKLIQELIERLLKQAEEEASHKGWCDLEYQTQFMARDKAVANIKDTNSFLELSEPRRAKLGEEIETLEAEIKELDGTLSNATRIRDEEKAENKVAVTEAKEGSAIVAKAIDVLAKFYKTAENEAAEFVQQGSKEEPEIPDAGFDGAYTGAQDGAVGVLGMLEVVKSDFDRTASETEAAEKAAAKEFLELETTVGMSKAEKSETLKSRVTAKSDADKEDHENREKLKASQKSLDAVIDEVAALDKACQLGGTTPEERKQKREEEMAALKNALCIIDKSENAGAECLN